MCLSNIPKVMQINIYVFPNFRIRPFIKCKAKSSLIFSRNSKVSNFYCFIKIMN